MEFYDFELWNNRSNECEIRINSRSTAGYRLQAIGDRAAAELWCKV